MILDHFFDIFQCVSDQRTKFSILLLEYFCVSEMICELESSLISCVAKVANFCRVILPPSFPMELFKEGFYIRGIYKVQKGITNITFIIFVDWQIKKVDCIVMIDWKLLKESFLCVFIGDILDHYRCSTILFNFIKINNKSFAFLWSNWSFVPGGVELSRLIKINHTIVV